MKKFLLTLTLILSVATLSIARNTTTRVTQVSTSVTLSEDVDYVITSTTPFTSDGSINITNTEHAVVILSKIRPSKALELLKYIKINGRDAVNDSTCQVKMYCQGSIIMPYGKDFKPLTIFTEQNFAGESCNDYGLEHSNGYMNNMTSAKLNNKARSFKLKRGYMVTFSIGNGGRGYSRCFIADYADLEFPILPTVLDQRISSYRIFKWNDAEKKGIANDTGYEITQALNASWCYSFGPGEDRGIDCECVPHKIGIPWPGNCGTINFSPHLKTNNEPGNEADHGVENLDDVLATWEDLMATGKRLCSPSSHDGSLQWLRNFMDSIDARGWRCDILDLHCYWPQWNLLNQVKGWYDTYKRPIWISEFVWGSSWGNTGIFAEAPDGWDSYSSANQQKNYDGMKPVFDNWNNAPYIERYAYWNSERNCSKIYMNGSLSTLGKHYAEMNSNIGYNRAYEFVPKVVYKGPNNFVLTYTEKTKKLELTWNNPNGELTDTTFLEVSYNGGEWETVQKYESSEKTTYLYNTTLSNDFEKGVYSYRVRNVDSDGNTRYTNEQPLTLIGASGTKGFQYGRLELSNTEEVSTEFTPVDGEESPAVFTGFISNNNTNTVSVNTVTSVDNSDGKFKFRLFPWNEGSYTQTLTEKEETDFMVMSLGQHIIGDIRLEVAKIEKKISSDSVWVDFATPFDEGVTPVVIANFTSRTTRYPYMVKILKITNKGFALKLARQEATYEDFATTTAQYVYYAAATPGTAKTEEGKILSVGINTEDLVDGTRARAVYFLDNTGEKLKLVNPYIICGPQSNNYDVATVYRINSYRKSNITVGAETVSAITGIQVLRQKDETTTSSIVDKKDNNGDYLGRIIISDDTSGTSVTNINKDKDFKVRVINGQIFVNDSDNYSIYAVTGQRVANNNLKGIYIVRANGKAIKVFVP